MKLKEMILIELLLDRLGSRIDPNKNYQLVFELNEVLYTGNFVEEETDSNKKYVRDFDELSFTAIEPNYHLYQPSIGTDRGGDIRLIIDFIDSLNISDSQRTSHVKDLAKVNHLLLQKIKEFISESDPNNYLSDKIDFANVIYNLKSLDENINLDFYIVDEEKDNITLVSLKEDKWLI